MSIKFVIHYFILCFITVGNCNHQRQLEEKNIIASAQVNNRPIVAIFLADHCPWSKKLQQEVLQKPYFLDKINEEAILWIYSLTQNEGERVFIQKYHIQQCPFILLLDPNGKEFSRFEYMPFDAEEYVKKIIAEIENFQEICSALDQGDSEFEEQKWQEIYQRAKRLSVPYFRQVILERGLSKEKSNYFHLEKFATLLEKHKMKHLQVHQAKQQLLNRDPENKLGTHFKVAVLEFQKIASYSRRKDHPEKALVPLLQYIRKFGKKDPENYWKSELMVAEFLYDHKFITAALKHAKLAYLKSPEALKPQIAAAISHMDRSVD